MTPLRQKLIRAMDLRNLSKHTQRAYLSAVTGLAKHYQQSPEKITATMIEDYLLYLKNEKCNAPGTCCLALTGLRFFYTHILDKQISVGFNLGRKPRRLPTVLTKEEVWRIICTPKNLKHRLILMTTYSAGLRAGEVMRLKPDHIDSKRMLIKVVNGKGRKDRYTMLSAKLLSELRHYYKACCPQTYLFPSNYKKHGNKPLSYESVRSIYDNARRKVGVKNGEGLHTLRHYAEFRIMPSSVLNQPRSVSLGYR
jgi:integrase